MLHEKHGNTMCIPYISLYSLGRGPFFLVFIRFPMALALSGAPSKGPFKGPPGVQSAPNDRARDPGHGPAILTLEIILRIFTAKLFREHSQSQENLRLLLLATAGRLCRLCARVLQVFNRLL